MHVTDLQGNEYAIQATTINDMELNGEHKLEVTIESSKVNNLFIDNIAEMWTITDHDDVEHKIIYVTKQGNGDELVVKLRAMPLFYDVLNTNRIYEDINQHMTAQVAFNEIFDDTGFTFVLVDSFDAVQWQGFGNHETKLESFKRALERYKAEFRIVGNIVYLEKQIGNDTQHMYRHRLNASNIVQDVDATNLWTYAKGYGDYGGNDESDENWQDAKLVREYTSPIASIIGIRHAPPITNGNIKDTSTMDSQLKTLVDESLKISITADIHDLTKQNYPIGQSNVGDRVFVIDERIGLNEEVRVVNKKIMRDWRGRILDIELTFGTDGIAKRYQANLSTAMKNITDLLAGKLKLPFSSYDIAVQQATKMLQGIVSQLVVPDNGGLMAIDTNNPNNVVLFNAAGIGVSHDGGATFKNSITGLGVVAETIIGQSIIGVNITSADESGYFHVNGSNAEFVNATNNRKVEISPDGLYGKNANGSIGFQADGSLVTSAAFGTSNTNVYLACMENGESRSVKYRTLGGSGSFLDYEYVPHRAQIFRFPDLDHGYFTLYNGTEFRFTGENTGEGRTFLPIRIGGLLSNSIETNGGNIIYMYSDDRVRSMLRSNRDAYAAFEGSDFIQSSSRELKENIRDYDRCATDILCDLNIVEFDYIDGDKGRIGVIAEESKSIGDGKSVSLGDTTFLHTKAIQELADRLTILENENKKLRQLTEGAE